MPANANAQGSREHCYEVVQDVLLYPETYGMYSDLFITRNRLIFVRLAEVALENRSDPSLSAIATRGVESVAGDALWKAAQSLGLVDAVREARDVARNAAADARSRLYGVSLEARARSAACILARESIRGFKLHSGPENVGVIECLLSRGSLNMGANAAVDLLGRLQLWLAGEPVDVTCDRQGLSENLPRLGDLLGWIFQPSKFPEITLDDCTAASGSYLYCDGLAEELKRRVWPQRERLGQLIKDRSPKLAAGVGAVLEASPDPLTPLTGRKRNDGPSATIGMLIVTAFFVFEYFSSPPASRSGWDFFAALGALGIVLGIVLWAGESRDRSRNRQLAAELRQGR